MGGRDRERRGGEKKIEGMNMGDGRVEGGCVKLEKWIDEEGRKIERIGEKEGEGMKMERGGEMVGMWG